MAVNLNAPSGRQSPVLVIDATRTTGGSVDSITPKLTNVTVGGEQVPVQVCEEWNSIYPLLFPRLTYAQLAALTAITDGMIAFDTTHKGIAIVSNGALSTFNTGMISVTLTRAQILGMNAAPVQLIAAQGAGLSIMVDKVLVVNNFQVAAFANGGVVTIGYGAVAAVNALTATIPAAFINNAASATYRLYGESGATLATAATANQPIFITNATGAFTGGNAASTVTVNIWYSVITT